jgi:undecaprenyl-diphosphatase
MRRRQRLLTVARRATVTASRWLASQEATVLLAALGVVLGLFGFSKIAAEMLQGDLQDFDEWLLRLLRRPENPHIPIGPLWLMEAALDITSLGSRTLLLLVILSAAGYLALDRRYGAMWFVVAAAGGGGLLSTVMKQLFGRGRPDIVPHLVTVVSPSFPSGHSMLAAVIYLTLGALLARFAARRRARIYALSIAILVTFLVGSSRVYLGVHYPTDVLAGWCAGLVWALACWLVARYLQYRGAVEQPGRTARG